MSAAVSAGETAEPASADGEADAAEAAAGMPSTRARAATTERRRRGRVVAWDMGVAFIREEGSAGVALEMSATPTGGDQLRAVSVTVAV